MPTHSFTILAFAAIGVWLATPAAHADESWWSLRPLADVQPPSPGEISDVWADHPIDRFVLAKLREKELQPSRPADRRALIRRLTYDLTGLPPTPDDVERFVHDDARNAYERLVDRLLDSPHYGEHWGRHWLDVVRFGESTGFERNILINNLWPFRDYIIRSFNEDKPFDRLVLEHLAGDVLTPGNPEVEVGTAFLVCGPYDNVGNQDPVQVAQIRANTIDEVIRATSEAFLGLTVGCARCHDHKFDPVSQRDYYAMYATLAGVFHGNRPVASEADRQQHFERMKQLQALQQPLHKERQELEKAILERAEQRKDEYEARWTRPPVDRRGTEETFEPVRARYVRLHVDALESNPKVNVGFRIDEFEVWTAGAAPRNAALSERGGRAEGASRVAEDFEDAYSASLTIDGAFGACWIAAEPRLTITLAEPTVISRVYFSSDRTGAAQQNGVATFVGAYRIEVSLDGQQWTQVASSADRQPVTTAHRRHVLLDLEATSEERQRFAEIESSLADLRRRLLEQPQAPNWWIGYFQTVSGPFRVFRGGNPQTPGDEVRPASLSALDLVTSAYRLADEPPESQRRLALARWIVSPDNPLTPRVLANRLWHYHFGTGIVDTPSDFGAMGGRPTHPALLDWLARQVHVHGWRLKPLHRLIVTSQAYRQSAADRPDVARIDADDRWLARFPPRRLTAEEIRNTFLSVAGVLDTRMGGPGFRLYRYLEDNVATYVPRDDHGPETYRHAVYHQNARASRIDLMSEFDCPDSAFAAPRRAVTTTPLQALTLMNHAFTLGMAEAFAKRLRREAGDDRASQIRRAFELAFSRMPSESDVKAADRLIATHGLPAFCRAILNTNELIYLH